MNHQTTIAEKLNPKDLQGQGQRPPWDGRWRMTECIGCPAAPLHIAMGCKGGEGIFPKETLALFYEGNLHEDDLKARIREAGETIIDFPSGMVALDIPVVCHPDGYLVERKAILETKSLGGEEPDTEVFIAEHQNYVKQVMCYERITGVDKGYLITKMRTNGWIMPDMLVEHDPKITEPIWENVKRVETILQTNPTSCSGPWYPTCSNDFRTRLFCPFNSVHCHTSEAQVSGELEALLSDYGTNKVVSDLLTTRVENIRAGIEALMAEGGLRRQRSSEGILASITSRPYTSADKDVAQKLLPKDVYEQIFHETRSSSLRITIPKVLREGVVLPWT